MQRTQHKKDIVKEIMQTEKDFAKLVKDQGLTYAFLYYADENAVLNRQNKLIRGKEAIRNYLEQNQAPERSKLEWTPDAVEVSELGDLAWTYGKYQYHFAESTGKMLCREGIFHTIWKKQANNTWRYVWD
jgi:ketosteroid isomerase-like protein